MNQHFAIAIDGPAGAGKSSVAKKVAAELNALYLDTGAMYRTVGLYMLRNGIDVNDREAVALHADEAAVDVRYVNGEQRVCMGSEDVSEAIRENQVSAAASAVSQVPQVRENLVKRQREIAMQADVVMDGRDIGTRVLPDAGLKIFLTAQAEVRAERRYDELKAKGREVPYEQLLEEIRQRDYADSHREVSPMIQAEDAVLVDSSAMSIDQVVERIISLAGERWVR